MPGKIYLAGPAVTRKLFTGKERDAETHWDYFGARYYSPALGRWLAVDPAFFQWEIKQLAERRLFGFSAYVYVRNNPIIRVDPDGYVDLWKVGVGILGIVGGLTETLTGGAIAAGSSPTVAGPVLGVALMVHGLSTVGFGITQVVAGLVDNGKEDRIPGGPFEGFGAATKNETFQNAGKIADGIISLAGANIAKEGITQGAKSTVRDMVKSLDVGKSLPLSAREARKAAELGVKHKLQVAKDVYEGVSTVHTGYELGKSVHKIVKSVSNNDEPKEENK
ncbi:MAG: RHS repeat-associated core domain-containing protein [Methanobacteriota archaeon]|nr:MAG: RHS repeat-associated core domain-containing protein [Euryarchaeota archaeon]